VVVTTEFSNPLAEASVASKLIVTEEGTPVPNKHVNVQPVTFTVLLEILADPEAMYPIPSAVTQEKELGLPFWSV
jgi:hypothetical protein